MLRIIKKIVFRDKIYPAIRKTPLFGLWHWLNGRIASMTHWNPWEKLFVIGVTWTDWKTTTTLLIQHLVNKLAGKCIAISTESVIIDKEKISNTLKMSSLSPYKLQEYLDIAVKRWCKFAVLETTSHWLDQRRFEWIGFSCGVLTNITPEHLDYHGTLENYALAKRRLFERVIENDTVYKWAVLPKDDERWRKRANEMPFDKIIDYWVNMNCSLKAENIITGIDWTNFDIKYLWATYPVKTRLLWRFNAYNYLAAVSIWLLMWWSVQQIIEALEDYTPIDGRQDKVIYNDVTYFIDFAHTPNWLQNILTLLKDNKTYWRIITVFWAPWLRDRYKRPEMWSIVDQMSDVVILTEDDSMTESTQQIIKEVAKWIQRQEWDNYYIIPHRKDAVRFATEIAQPWDMILLAGKWHERHLYTNFGKIEYHEKTFLEELLWITQL